MLVAGTAFGRMRIFGFRHEMEIFMALARLQRTTTDFVLALLVLPALLASHGIMFFGDLGTTGKSFWIVAYISGAANAAFIALTPAMILQGNILLLYPEVQPVLFPRKPMAINIEEITNLKIIDQLGASGVVFTLRHNDTYSHWFGTARAFRVKRFLEFLKTNTSSSLVEEKYAEYCQTP